MSGVAGPDGCAPPKNSNDVLPIGWSVAATENSNDMSRCLDGSLLPTVSYNYEKICFKYKKNLYYIE